MGALVDTVQTFLTKSAAIIGDLNVEHVQNDISSYFNMSIDDLSKMDKEDCIHAQYFILQYSISITKKINQVKARLAANKKEFNRSFAQVYNSYNTYNGYDIILGLAISEHSHLKSMDDEITKLEALIQEYEGLGFRAEKLAQVFKDLSFCK